MNKSSIEWCDFTHNPIVGCNYGCEYCYAKKINDRFKFIPDWSKPQFFPERLNFKVPKIPKNRNRIAAELSPDKPIVFMNSMFDIADTGAPTGWTKKVLSACDTRPEQNSFFVSKRLTKLFYCLRVDRTVFENIGSFFFGLTLASYPKFSLDGSIKRNIEDFKEHYNAHIFANIEPLHASFEGVDLSMFEFVIVGPETRNGKPVPMPKAWIESIKHERIYYKDKIYELYPELK